MSAETNIETDAVNLRVGDLLYDPVKSGTHGSRVDVQWVREHRRRRRTYVAGVEERSGDPVQLAYDNGESVKLWR